MTGESASLTTWMYFLLWQCFVAAGMAGDLRERGAEQEIKRAHAMHE